MKKSLAGVFVLALVAIVVFCGCDMSLAPQSLENNTASATCSVYVAGAVQNEGYYTVSRGATRYDAIVLAGMIEQTVLPQDVNAFITEDAVIYVDYFENGSEHSPIDVNGPAVKFNAQIEGIAADVIQDISDYLTAHGTITDKTQLKTILGDCYEQNYYKLFVAPEAYQKAD